MPYGFLVTQSTYCMILPTSLVNICPSGPAKFYVVLKVIPSEVVCWIQKNGRRCRERLFLLPFFFNWREHFVFSCDLKLISNQFLKTYILQRSTSLLEFPRRDIFQTPSKRKCSIFDLFWPDLSIKRG